MVHVTRYTPFENSFDQLLRGIFAQPAAFDASAQPAQSFRVDVREDDSAYTIFADIPGVKKEDIQVTIDADQIAISAETRNEREVKDAERVLRSERRYGKFHRAFALDQAVDEDKAVAKYADGVLELTLPKKAAVSAKRLSIN